MNKKFLNISTIILTFVLTGLQMMPSDWNNLFCNWLRDYSFWIAFGACIIVVGLHLLDWLFSWDGTKKKWLRTFLKHIVDEHLGSDTYQIRISILRKQRGYIVFFKTLWYYVFVCFFNNFKNCCWKESFSRVAIHLLSDYLVIYVRYSYPKAKKSCTYFRLSDMVDRGHYNGIADRCFQDGIEINVMTNNISDIELPKNILSLSEGKRKKVKRYMKDCHIAEEYYGSLRTLHKISNNLYAVPVALNDQSIWGVVIVDCVGDICHNFKEDLKDCMASYMKIINFSLSSLK